MAGEWELVVFYKNYGVFSMYGPIGVFSGSTHYQVMRLTKDNVSLFVGQLPAGTRSCNVDSYGVPTDEDTGAIGVLVPSKRCGCEVLVEGDYICRDMKNPPPKGWVDWFPSKREAVEAQFAMTDYYDVVPDSTVPNTEYKQLDLFRDYLSRVR